MVRYVKTVMEFKVQCKVENVLRGSPDLIPAPSPHISAGLFPYFVQIACYFNNNFPQSGPALQGCTVNVPVPKAVSS